MLRSRLFRISHRRHTGKYLAHHHTSWAGLTLLLLLCGLLLLACSLTGAARLFAAPNQMEVTATVTGPAPNTAPTITNLDSEAHVTAAQLTLRGICQPGLTVVAFSNSLSRGSAVCDSSHRYQLAISLDVGRNELTVAQYDTLDQASPFSDITVIYYDPPIAPVGGVTPSQSDRPNTVPTSSPSKPIATTSVQSALTITTNNHFQGVTSGSEFRLIGTVHSGTKPFAVSVDWGDQHTDLLSLAETGRFEAVHTYAHGGSYTITIKVADAAGITAIRQTVVSIIGAPAAIQPTGEGTLQIAWPIYLAMVLLCLGFGLGDLYAHQQRDLPSHPA